MRTTLDTVSTRGGPRRQPRPIRRGLGMVEMLLALAICAMVLTSVAVAFRASLQTAEENQKISTITQLARVILNRMMTECREADDVEELNGTVIRIPLSHTDPNDPNDPNNPNNYNERWLQCSDVGITLPSGQTVEYQLANGSLKYIQNYLRPGYVLIGPGDGWIAGLPVTINQFNVITHEIDTNKADPNFITTAVSTEEIIAQMTLQVGANTFAVTASTNPRRKLAW